MNVPELLKELERDEGLRLHPYRDTVGKLTIGIGRNLDDVGISEAEARFMLANDAARAERDARRALPSFDDLSDARKRALVNMSFNLGLPRLLGFKNMLAALAAGDYERAAAEALDSVWARQVGDRAERIVTMIREG